VVILKELAWLIQKNWRGYFKRIGVVNSKELAWLF